MSSFRVTLTHVTNETEAELYVGLSRGEALEKFEGEIPPIEAHTGKRFQQVAMHTYVSLDQKMIARIEKEIP